MRVADLINPFKNIETPPPQTLGAFIRWSLSGAWPMLFVAAAVFGHRWRDGGRHRVDIWAGSSMSPPRADPSIF